MTILLDASLDCNGACLYCYNRPIRTKKPRDIPNIPAIKETMKRLVDAGVDKHITMHGGEPLFLPFDALKELLEYSFLLTGESSIQSNGTLITDAHIKLFKDCKTSVGISIDGPEKLNRFRFNKKTTSKIIENIYKLKKNGISVGLLCVISKANGLKKYREQFKEFILNMKAADIQGRLLPCSHPDPRFELTIEEAKEFYGDMADFLMEQGIWGWSPFSDVVNSICGRTGDVWCFFKGCDPYCTKAGIVITSSGAVSVCHKFQEEHISYTSPYTTIRKDILSQTDCAGCRFFDNCTGGCPADSVDWDWRNKTRWCPVWKMLFEKMENILKFADIETLIKKIKEEKK